MSKEQDFSLFRHDDPPTLGKHLPILRVEGLAVTVVCIVAAKWEGYFSHWHQGCSYRCKAHLGDCPGCKELKAPRRWTGFLDTCTPDGRGGSFVQLSADAAHNLLRVKDLRPDLRGMLVGVRRSREGMKSPLVFVAHGEYSGRAVLRKPVAADATIKRLWKEFESGGQTPRKRLK